MVNALISGFFWAAGMVFVAYALKAYLMPISVLAPLYNMNTLVAVVLGLWLFQEWKTLQVSYLVIGAVLIVVGGILVSKA